MLFPGNSRWNPYLSSGDKSSSEMTVRRNRYAATVPPGYFASTKGHSALRKWSYYPPSRAAVYAEDIYVPTDYVRPRSYYDTTREENEIRRDVNSELIYTSNLIDDSYDVAAKSRNRDQSLLREASRALPSSTTDKKTSLTPARRFHTNHTSPISPSLFTKGPMAYSTLTPPMYRGTTNVQPLGVLTKLDWTSPLRKYAIPSRLRELNDDDNSSDISPYATPTQSIRSSPDREPYARPKRYKGRIGPRKRGGNYYRRVLRKRNGRSGSAARYNPYGDGESVASDDIDDASNGEYYNDYPADSSDAGVGEYYIVDRERSPSPLEYVPYGPSRRIDFDSGEYDCQVPSLPDLAMSPYIPQSDPTSDPERAKITDDILFHNIVARTASKARDALQNVNLDEYDNASLVISVEGEYKDPLKGENMGFHYIARPLTLKGPMLAGPAVYASTASDSAFTRYMDDMRSFRAEIRNRLETGYETLRQVSSKYPTHSSYPIIASSHRSYSRALSPIRSSSAIPIRSSSPTPSYRTHSSSSPLSFLRKRLGDIEDRYKRREYEKRLEDDISADRLVVYPITQKASIPAISASEVLPGHTHTVDLYQASEKGTELSTLEKINIKAALVGNKVEVTTPRHRRPRSDYAANKLRELRREDRELEVEAIPQQATTSLKATTVTPSPTDYKDYKPISDVRRRVRRVICKNRGNPRYFKEN